MVRDMADAEVEVYTGEQCPYCGNDLYYTAYRWYSGGRLMKENKSRVQCGTPACSDKRAAESQ